MIRSTKVTTQFINTGKQKLLREIREEYRRGLEFFINELWSYDEIPLFLPKEVINNFTSWLSKRMLQCCAKQASGIVRGVRKKQQERLYRIKKLMKEGKREEAKHLQRIYDTTKITKPVINNFEMALSPQIVSAISFNSDTSFEGWITLTSIGNKIKLQLPFNKNKHFNRLLKRGGSLKNSIKIGKKHITFVMELPDSKEKTEGSIVGLDIGQTTLISVSDGQAVGTDPHGHTMKSICDKLARKKKGSKGFLRAQKHRDNFIHYCINQIDWKNIKTLRIEKIRNLRFKKRISKSLSGWVSSRILDLLKVKCEDSGVRVVEISPTYTSQRCSKCGWVQKANRTGKVFRCKSCGYTDDADMNAARNISFTLPEVDWSKKQNRKGFYWNSSYCASSDTSL